MSAAWAVQSLVAVVLLGVAALAVERVAAWLGAPARAAWAGAMAASLSFAALPLFAPGLLPRLWVFPGASPAIGGLDDLGLGFLPGGPGPGGEAVLASPAWGVETVLLSMWAIATVAMLGAVVWTYWRFRRLRARTSSASVAGVRVRVAERVGPAVMGLLRPEIVLPRWALELPEEELRLIVMHEREHLEARDGWLLFAGTVTVALMPWCVPLWWQHHRLRQAIETDCDARVLARGASRRSYGRILIRTAGTTPGIPLLNPAWGESTSQLERRIMRMTAKRPRHPVARSIPLLALALAIVATACSVAGRSPAERPLAASPSAMQVNTSTISYAPGSRRGDTGIVGIGWPEGGGPSFSEAGVVLPTRHAVVSVREGGSAWNAGLRDGDVIVALNGVDSRTVVSPFADRTPGKRYSVRVRRGAQEHEFTLEVGPPSI